MNRREILKAGGYIGTGAIGITAVNRIRDDTAQYNRHTLGSIEREMVIDEEDWFSYPFAIDDGGFVTYEVAVRDGPRIETMVLTDDQYTAFQQRRDVDALFDSWIPWLDNYDQDLSKHGLYHLQDDEDIPADEYVFVVDNTNKGETEINPDNNGPADVDIDFSYGEYRTF